jgi:hypothetical protein
MSAGATLKAIFELAKEQGAKVLYPGLPFLFVPSLLASIIIGQFSGSLTLYPNDEPSALELPVQLSKGGRAGGPATLVVIPSAADFFLGASGKGIDSVWLSVDSSILEVNHGRVDLGARGLGVEPLRGVSYPVVMVVQGEHGGKVAPAGRESHALPRLELATALSNWVVFFLLSGAVFGFGVSTGFVNDRGISEQKN